MVTCKSWVATENGKFDGSKPMENVSVITNRESERSFWPRSIWKRYVFFCSSYDTTSSFVNSLFAQVGEIFVDENDQKGCSFNIQVLGRLYYLRAENRATCKDWVITLNRVKEARLQQGNVKLLDPAHGPVDLLDANEDLTTPRVVVVANRGRTRAVAETQDWGVLIPPSEDNTSSSATPSYLEKRRTALETVVLGRWSKRKTTLSRIKAKLARWARSVRNLGCTQADSAVQLDHHVHPPGHDYKTSRDSVAKSRLPTASKEVDLFGSHQATKKTTGVSGVKPSGINRATSTTSVESARFLA